ncbi:antibiotic biosynthesis monooxygenase family protein [Streptomyces oceani]|uniref:Antibiotic biosynthesis monooxygenase n=1 Tax=Streptomyces oceani TaxID=1075402 RepID=A0A1E7KM56_9ACTN|nr:antibiotic biosynthesis monooxygenase [Streptomyces oceani]OEV04954.1 antibiotic biosynthesis monooxygenase [Streptomyces oceani]
MATDSCFYSIIDYTVDGPETQTELVRAFAEIQEQWVNFHPGYLSARFHVSTDGTRVYNIVRWESEADYRRFVETSDTDGRMAAIERALAGLSGTAEPRMSGSPTYTVVREVGPRVTE